MLALTPLPEPGALSMMVRQPDRRRGSRREEMDPEEAAARRSSFRRRNDFIVLSSNPSRDPDGNISVKARVCTTKAASSTFSVLRPSILRGASSRTRRHRRTKTDPVDRAGDTWSARGGGHKSPAKAPTVLSCASSLSRGPKFGSGSTCSWVPPAGDGKGEDNASVGPGDFGELMLPPSVCGDERSDEELYGAIDTWMSRSPGGSSIDSPTRSVPVESESGKGGEGEIAGAEAGGELKGGAAEASRAADIDRLMQNASVRSFLANSDDEEEPTPSTDAPTGTSGDAGARGLTGGLAGGFPRGGFGRGFGGGDCSLGIDRRRPSSGSIGRDGIGGNTDVYDSYGEDSSDSDSADSDAEECEDWMGVVPVDPDTIELALPPAMAGSTKDFDILEFQANLRVGVRYGHSADIGSRRVMEDRTTVVRDIFNPSTPPSLGSRAGDPDARSFGRPCSPASAMSSPAGTPCSAKAAAFNETRAAGVAGSVPGGASRSFPNLRSPSTLGSLSRVSTACSQKAGSSNAAPGPSAVTGGRQQENKPSLLLEEAQAVDRKGEEDDNGESSAVSGLQIGFGDEVESSGSFLRTGSEGVLAKGGSGRRDGGIVARDGYEDPRTAAFFAVYDGHDGDVVAESLHQDLHKLLAKQDCFAESVPHAIEKAFYEMDAACLEVQFRWLQKERGLVEDSDSILRMKNGEIADPDGGGSGSRTDMVEGARTDAVRSGYAGSPLRVLHRSPTSYTSPTLAPIPMEHDISGDKDGDASEGRGRDSTGMAGRAGAAQSASLLRSRRLGGASRTKIGGAAAVVAVVTLQGDDTVIYAANVGDCRAVLCRGGVAVDLTSDHRTSREDELARVNEAGGYILRGRLNGILGVTRAFGDIGFKEYPPTYEGGLWDRQQLTSQPEMNSVVVQPEDHFLILACDGVWDVISSQQATSFVHRRLLRHHDVQRASRELCKTLARMDGSDNCSCVIVCLNQVKRTPMAYPQPSPRTPCPWPSRSNSASSKGNMGWGTKSGTCF